MSPQNRSTTEAARTGQSPRARRTHGSRARLSSGSLAVHALLILVSVVTLIPTAWLVLAAFKPEDRFAPSGRDVFSLFIPRWEPAPDTAAADQQPPFLNRDWQALTDANFRELLGIPGDPPQANNDSSPDEPAPKPESTVSQDVGFLRAIRNSFFFASVTPLIATLVAAMAGYALARLNFRGRGTLATIILAALIVPPPLLLAPTFVLLNGLGLLNTLAGLVLPLTVSAFGVFLFRQATIQSVPAELVDAATIDGCGEARSFFAVGLPLLRPMIGAFMIVSYLACWNNFITPQIILQAPELRPLSVMIVQLRGTYGDDYGLLMAGTLLSILPVAAMFLLLQRDFVRGLTAGAVKG